MKGTWPLQHTEQETTGLPSKGVVLTVLTLLAGCVLYFAWATRDCFVDDAYIDFQYIRNLLDGRGFVFNAGEPAVEGITNVGWLLFLTPFALLAGPTVAAKLVGLALLLASLGLTVRLGWKLAAGVDGRQELCGLVLVPAVLLATSFDYLYFSLAGMETALLAVVLLLMTHLAMRKPHSTALPLLGAFAFLVHPEAVIVYPLYCLLLPRGAVDRWKLWRGNLMLAALIGAATAIRYVLFGDVVPNTFHSKPANLFQVVYQGYGLLMGRNVNVPFPLSGWLALVVLVFGYLRLRRVVPEAAAMLAAVAGAGLAFCVYSPPDWTATGRYFAPYLPAGLLLFWAGLVQVVYRLLGHATRPPTLALARTAIVVLLVLTGTFDGFGRMSAMETFPGYILAGKNLVQPSLWIRDHLDADATIASRRIGALAYYSRKRVFDYTFGLPDREVARLVAAAGRRFDSPDDPALAALWSARAPDYLLEDGEMLDYIVSGTGGTRQHFAIHGLPYGVIKRFSIGREKDWVLVGRLSVADAYPQVTRHAPHE